MCHWPLKSSLICSILADVLRVKASDFVFFFAVLACSSCFAGVQLLQRWTALPMDLLTLESLDRVCSTGMNRINISAIAVHCICNHKQQVQMDLHPLAYLAPSLAVLRGLSFLCIFPWTNTLTLCCHAEILFSLKAVAIKQYSHSIQISWEVVLPTLISPKEVVEFHFYRCLSPDIPHLLLHSPEASDERSLSMMIASIMAQTSLGLTGRL